MHTLGNSLLGCMPNRNVHMHDKSLYKSSRMLLSSPSVRASKEQQPMCLSARSLWSIRRSDVVQHWKQANLCMWNNVNESHKHVDSKKLDTKIYLLYDSIYIVFLKKWAKPEYPCVLTLIEHLFCVRPYSKCLRYEVTEEQRGEVVDWGQCKWLQDQSLACWLLALPGPHHLTCHLGNDLSCNQRTNIDGDERTRNALMWTGNRCDC